MPKELDLVVFGASGLTGRQVAAYLATRAPLTGARWAAAGRDRGRVARELEEIGVTAPEVIVADVNDPGSLRVMADRAKVVLNLVGPYTRYGRPVIEACVSGGAHYADLTGEISFVREMIEEFDAAAQDAGVKIVQVCGFESLPPDLCVRLASEAVRERFGAGLVEADLTVTTTAMPPGLPRPSDLLSGGTLQSIAAVAASDSPYDFNDPACLVTDPRRASEVRQRSPVQVRPRRGEGGTVIAPMAPAAFINPPVLHRSAALEGEEPFRYREGMAIPGSGAATLPLRLATAGALSGVQAAIRAIPRVSPAARARVGRVLTRALPQSGFGPAADRLEAWRWRVETCGKTASGTARVVLEAEGHPGYLATARMLGEAGLLMAEEGTTPQRSGCLTPAVAVGTSSAERFGHAGLRFEVR